MICNQCPRMCNIQRSEKQGFCHSPEEFRLARAALHMWEEPCISGKNGSGAVFFSGCNLKCAYCQNYEISSMCKGVDVSDDKFIDICKSLVDKGAHNINLVNPSHYANRIYNVFSKWDCPVPVVYNTGGYDSVDTINMMEGIVDVYLSDYKYSRCDKALLYSGAYDYPNVALRAINAMRSQVDDVFDGDMMTKGVIIRHLVLPGNTNSALEVLRTLHAEFDDTYISIMAQYTPCGNIQQFKELQRPLTKREYHKVLSYALSLNHNKIFIQELSSATKEYIPPFDFTGIV